MSTARSLPPLKRRDLPISISLKGIFHVLFIPLPRGYLIEKGNLFFSSWHTQGKQFLFIKRNDHLGLRDEPGIRDQAQKDITSVTD